jgi:dCTP deaminase
MSSHPPPWEAIVVLSDRTIREEIKEGRIVIHPLDDSCIQPASVDVHLDSEVRVFKPWKYPHYIDIRQPLEGLTSIEQIEEGEGRYFSLQPGQFVLGSTKEYFEVPNHIMARLEGKSSLGRVGLLIHATAGYVDPGFKGYLTLELYNLCALPIFLYAGMKISQISFHMLTTPADHPYGSPGLRSKYQDQSGPTATRSHLDFDQPALLSVPSQNLKNISMRESTYYSLASRSKYPPVLRNWLEQSPFNGGIKNFANSLGAPVKTVEEWFYRGVKPSMKYRAKIFAATGLREFQTLV